MEYPRFKHGNPPTVLISDSCAHKWTIARIEVGTIAQYIIAMKSASEAAVIVPPLTHLKDRGVVALEFCCQTADCRRAVMFSIEDFEARETVISLAARARCASCGALSCKVYPVWLDTGAGLPATYDEAATG